MPPPELPDEPLEPLEPLPDAGGLDSPSGMQPTSSMASSVTIAVQRMIVLIMPGGLTHGLATFDYIVAGRVLGHFLEPGFGLKFNHGTVSSQ